MRAISSKATSATVETADLDGRESWKGFQEAPSTPVKRSLYLIRPMVAGDLSAVLKLENQAFSDPWSRNLFAQELAFEHGFSLVVRKKEPPRELTAFACYRVHMDEMHILRLATSRSFRRRGVGARLLRACLKHAGNQGARDAYLEVREGNHAAIRFYKEKMGFHVIGVRPRYYDDTGEAAYLMHAKIQPPVPGNSFTSRETGSSEKTAGRN